MASTAENATAGAPATPQAVLQFWFGTPPYAARDAWFRKDEAFDDEIRRRFGAEVDAAIAGALPPAWSAGTEARLAQLLLLDQFTRNLFRGSARAFAGDARALALALELVASGEHLALDPLQRWFVYLPLEHAEDLALQRRSVELFAAMAPLSDVMKMAHVYAERHRDVIERFGRFPHRNAALGRASTPEELAFLQQPGSSF